MTPDCRHQNVRLAVRYIETVFPPLQQIPGHFPTISQELSLSSLAGQLLPGATIQAAELLLELTVLVHLDRLYQPTFP